MVEIIAVVLVDSHSEIDDDHRLWRMDAPLPFLRHSCFPALLLLLSHLSHLLQIGCSGRPGGWLARTGWSTWAAPRTPRTTATSTEGEGGGAPGLTGGGTFHPRPNLSQGAPRLLEVLVPSMVLSSFQVRSNLFLSTRRSHWWWKILALLWNPPSSHSTLTQCWVGCSRESTTSK